MSCKFSFLIPFYIFQIYGVFINEVLEGCIFDYLVHHRQKNTLWEILKIEAVQIA
jgi:hypothetical protein